MSEGKNLYKGDEHASLYKKHRPDIDKSSLERIVKFLGQKLNPSECNAVDVGCGTGQATLPLAPFVRHVVGLDPSEAQIKESKTQQQLPDNVEFRVGEAENLPFKDASIHLVVVKSALHWFDVPKFLEQVDRILVPGGVLAVSGGTSFGTIVGHEEEVSELLDSLAKEYRTPEWKERVKLIFNSYKDVKFPYDDCIRDDTYVSEQSLTVQALMSNLKTRSDTAKFIRENPEGAAKALKTLEERLMTIIGASGSPAETNVLRITPQVLILCRKPK